MRRTLLALPLLLAAAGGFWFWQRQPLAVEMAVVERDGRIDADERTCAPA